MLTSRPPSVSGRLIVGVAVVLLVLAVVIGVLLSSADDDADESLEIAKALTSVAGSVAVTGILGVFVTTTLARRDRQRAVQEEQARLASVALQELKAGFEKVQIARIMLRANPTAGMLFEQAPRLLEARAHLQRVQRERSVAGSPADRGAQDMLDVVGDLLEAYGSNYYELADESRREALRAQGLEASEPTRRPLTGDARFSSLSEFLAEDRGARLNAGYDVAKDWLLERLNQPPDELNDAAERSGETRGR